MTKMGLILPQTVRVRTNPSNYKHYKEKGYEIEKCGDFIEVNVLDLPKRSREMVKVVCDICGKEREMWYRTVVKCNEENKLITCASNSCANKKCEDTCTKRYGVKNVAQSEEVKEKIKQTNLERYGCESAMQNEKIKNKIKETNLERYGYECTLQAEEVKKKTKETMIKKYGVDHPIKSSIIQDRMKATCKERYGAEHVLQNREILNKMLDSFQFNSTGPSSRAQRYICHILNGILNKHICGSLVDIYMEKENIVIEHDGSGHFLGDIINGDAFPTKESLLCEKQREDKIINNGYRIIRFIATKDRIPSDEVILNLIEEFKNSDFKVMRINFEESTIEKDYKEKSYCDFGELRKITKEDLEKFEKQEENTSEN